MIPTAPKMATTEKDNGYSGKNKTFILPNPAAAQLTIIKQQFQLLPV